jgi:hypothetical protein
MTSYTSQNGTSERAETWEDRVTNECTTAGAKKGPDAVLAFLLLLSLVVMVMVMASSTVASASTTRACVIAVVVAVR